MRVGGGTVLRTLAIAAALIALRGATATDLESPIKKFEARREGADLVLTWALQGRHDVARVVVRGAERPECPQTLEAGFLVADLEITEKRAGQFRVHVLPAEIPYCFSIFAVSASGVASAPVSAGPRIELAPPPPVANLHRTS